MNQTNYPFPLFNIILEILEKHPSGINEYNLLKELAENPQSTITMDSLSESLGMFRTHFLLFYTLYHLKDYLEKNKQETLEIHCLNIQLKPLKYRGVLQISKHDPLREYYQNLDNVKNINKKDVEKLLQNFWHKFYYYNHKNPALEILGVTADASITEIESQYKKLVKKHHPDVGGDNETFQKIQQAMESIRALYEG